MTSNNNKPFESIPKSKTPIEAALESYINAFENLTEQSLTSDLMPLLSEQVRFKDPFNDVQSKQATVRIFEHMFQTVSAPKFTVKHAALEGHTAYLHWDFAFRLKGKSDIKTIEGLSQVNFDSTGLVTAHIDYWDPAEQVYSQIPVLNWLIKQVAKRLSASTATT